MALTLTTENFKRSLGSHAAVKGEEIRSKYGPHLGWKELNRLLEDREFVRYPCKIVFDAGPLNPGEFAHPVARGECPEDGFVMYVHPLFMMRLSDVPPLVLYQLVLVNYGEFAGPADAEAFGAGALGLSRDDYYSHLCSLADQIEQCAASSPE